MALNPERLNEIAKEIERHHELSSLSITQKKRQKRKAKWREIGFRGYDSTSFHTKIKSM